MLLGDENNPGGNKRRTQGDASEHLLDEDKEGFSSSRKSPEHKVEKVNSFEDLAQSAHQNVKKSVAVKRGQALLGDERSERIRRQTSKRQHIRQRSKSILSARSGLSINQIKDNFIDHDRKMPLKDKISLGPIEKYTIYNRFPYKLVLHIILLILTSTIVSVSVQKSQSQLRAQQYVWYKKFILNDDGDDVPVFDDFNREKRYFTI